MFLCRVVNSSVHFRGRGEQAVWEVFLMTGFILYFVIPLAALAIIVAFITAIVKLVWRGRNNR